MGCFERYKLCVGHAYLPDRTTRIRIRRALESHALIIYLPYQYYQI